MHWYYTIKRERFGPVDERTIKNLISSGKLKKEDLVWNENMGDAWKTVGDEFKHLLAGTLSGPMNHRPTGGTGGTTPNARLTANARTALSGHWGLAIGGMTIYILVMLAIGMVAQIPFIGGFAQLFLMPPIIVGLMIFFLSIVRRQDAEIGQLFSGFHNYWSAVGAYFLSSLFMTLWMLPGLAILFTGMLFVPEFELSQQLPALPFYLSETAGLAVFGAGIAITWLTAVIVSLRYSQIYFVLADSPSLGALTSIRRSIRLMKGSKWKFVFLGLRFFGWGLLCMLTLGIGLIWLYPYMMTAFAAFYDDLKNQR